MRQGRASGPDWTWILPIALFLAGITYAKFEQCCSCCRAELLRADLIVCLFACCFCAGNGNDSKLPTTAGQSFWILYLLCLLCLCWAQKSSQLLQVRASQSGRGTQILYSLSCCSCDDQSTNTYQELIPILAIRTY